MTTNQGPLALAREIDEFRRQFEQISADADALVTPLADDQFAWKPTPHSWSIAECLEHMNATARAYLPAIDEGIADAIRHGAYAEGPFQYSVIGRLFSHLMEPPARLRMRDGTRQRARATTSQAGNARRISRVSGAIHRSACDRPTASTCRGRACDRRSFSWIRIPLGSAFASMAAHERRHLWQARKITQMAGFPA